MVNPKLREIIENFETYKKDNIYVAQQRTYVGTENSSRQNGHIKAILRSVHGKENKKSRCMYGMITSVSLLMALLAVLFVLEPETFESVISIFSSQSVMDTGYVYYLPFTLNRNKALLQYNNIER
jgi:hypothetical protein